MTTLSDAARAKRLAELTKRSGTALRLLLHEVAQAISDGEAERAEACMARAAALLRPRPWWRPR